MLWKAAVKALGHALKQEFQTKEKEMPDNIRKLLSQLEDKRNPNNKR